MDELVVQRLMREPQPEIEKGHSGYFTTPGTTLDPKLFTGDRLKPSVRQALLDRLYSFWHGRYNNPEEWSTVWIAGSAVSYQWHGDRGGLGDLDVLIGVDMAKFLEHNDEYSGIPENLIAKRFNNEFVKLLSPGTASWMGFEVTWYVNPGAADIRDIQPYAAYDVSNDTWTVRPIELPADWGPKYFPQEWHQAIGQEIARARTLVARYQQAAEAYQRAPHGPALVNAQAHIAAAAEAAGALYDDIHAGRKGAFNPDGMGYRDYLNFRWQSHKRAGTEQALRAIADGLRKAREGANTELYGAKDISNNRAVLDASLAQYNKRGLL